MGANDRQVGGTHYNPGSQLQHWDLVDIYGWDYYQGMITKYVMRWRDKNGIEDLEKAAHYLEKYLEIVRRKDQTKGASPGSGYVDQARDRQEILR
jgi:methyl coenzyme M reductase subunit C-like uncharacterized protein (methanogenesis marker protein 7)